MLAFSALPAVVSAQSVGDVVQSASGDYKAYKVVGENLIVNGSFDDGVNGWFNGGWNPASASDYVISGSGGFDGGAYVSISALGAGDNTTLRNHAEVEPGKTYMFLCYTGGSTPSSNNLQYNALWSSTDGKIERTKLYELKWNGSWTQNTFVFTPEEYTWVCMRNSWTSKAYLDGVFIGEVEEVSPNIPRLQDEIDNAKELDVASREVIVKDLLGKAIADAETYLESSDAAAVVEAIKALESAVAECKSMSSSIEQLRTEMVRAEKMGVDEAVLTELKAALKDVATTSDDINEMANSLNVKEYNAVRNNYQYATPLGAWTDPIGGGTSKGQHWSDDRNTTYFDVWNGSAASYVMKQTVTLPAGEYVLMASGRTPSNASISMSVNGALYTTPPVLFPKNGDTGYGIDVDGDANFSADGTYAKNGSGYGWQWRFIPFTIAQTKDVELSAYLYVNNSWGSIGNFELLSRGFDYVENWKQAQASAEAALADEQFAVVGGVARAFLELMVAKGEPVGGEEDFNSATQALKEAEAGFKAALPAYQSIASQIEVAKALSADVAEYEAIFTSETTTLEDVAAALEKLSVLQYNAVGENYTIDVTNLIGDVSAWNGDMVANKGQHWDGTGTSAYLEQTSAKWGESSWTTYMDRTVTLPAGKYVLKCTGRSSDEVSAYMAVNDTKIYMPSKGDTGFGVDVEGKANFSAEGVYANNNAGRGWEWRFLPFELTGSTEVTFRIYAETNTSHQWASFASVALLQEYDEVAVYVENWRLAKDSAEAALADEQFAVVGGAVRTTLKNEVAKEEPVGGEEEYVAASQALKDAEAAFKAALPTYQSVASQIEVAKALSADVAEYEAIFASETATVEEVFATLEGLNISQFNAVGENYTLDVTDKVGDISTWQGDMVTNKKQHWDGTDTSIYFEQTGDKWSSSAWTTYMDTTVTLPAGKYVLKCTGRASAGVSAYMSVDDAKSYMPSRGDIGYGVDVDGNANFSEDGIYANNNAGRGWEWRFLPFELTESKDVTFRIYAETSTSHQWVSFASLSLLLEYNEVAALEVAKNELKSVIAEAKSIVDTKPNVGEALFCIPETAVGVLDEATKIQQTVLDKENVELEELEEAIEAMAAAIEAFRRTPVNAPKADAEYIITHTASNFTMSLEDGVKLGENTTVKFEAVGDNTFYITDGNGEYVYYSGTGNNSWSMGVSSENKAAWTIEAVGDGTYTIKGKNGFIGTDDTTLGASCYGNKKDADEMKYWTIEEVSGPQIITPDMFEKVLDVDASYNVYYNSADEASYQLDIMSIAAALQIQSMDDVKVYVLDGEGAMVEAANMGFTDLWFNSNGAACAEGDADAAFYVRISQTFTDLMAGQNPDVVKENTDYNAVVYIVSGEKLVAVNIVYSVGVNVGINGVGADNVVSAEYYTVDGNRLNAPVKGLNVVVYKLTDGTSKTVKVYIK